MDDFQQVLQRAIAVDNVQPLYIVCVGLGVNCQSVQIDLGTGIPAKFREAVRDGLGVGRQWRTEMEQRPWRDLMCGDWRPLSDEEVQDGR